MGGRYGNKSSLSKKVTGLGARDALYYFWTVCQHTNEAFMATVCSPLHLYRAAIAGEKSTPLTKRGAAAAAQRSVGLQSQPYLIVVGTQHQSHVLVNTARLLR